jgi:hypothetical protein
MAEKNMKNPCWKGYEAYGMKKKNGKEVPNCVPVKEEIQQLTKQNIVSNILESKMKDGPGKTSQRPKSWDKGTKSGSEKRKMREQGKREARELHEESEKFDPSTLDMIGGKTIPPTSWHQYVPDLGKGTPPSKYYKHLMGQGKSHEEALKGTKNMYGMNPPVKFPKRSAETKYYTMRGPNGETARVAEHDVYDAMKDEFYESLNNKLKASLSETWESRESQREHAPHEYAIPDDIDRYENEEEVNQDTPLTHSEMVKHIGDAHEAALSRAFTAATMGKNKGKITPDEMRDAYHQHFDDVIRKLMDRK